VKKAGETLLHTVLFWLAVTPGTEVCGISAKKNGIFICNGLYITWTLVHVCTSFHWIQIDLIVYSDYQSTCIDDKYIISADLVQVIICSLCT